jgi:hypothetical protein
MMSLCRAIFPLILLSAPSVAQVEIAGCKSYEPASVSLHGTLRQKTFPGPPNYEDVHKGDKVETFWLLKLNSPICVAQDKSDPDLNPGQKDVREVELVLNNEQAGRANLLLSKRVVATGTLFGAHTGHHHTPVLLKVTYLDLPHWK